MRMGMFGSGLVSGAMQGAKLGMMLNEYADQEAMKNDLKDINGKIQVSDTGTASADDVKAGYAAGRERVEGLRADGTLSPEQYNQAISAYSPEAETKAADGFKGQYVVGDKGYASRDEASTAVRGLRSQATADYYRSKGMDKEASEVEDRQEAAKLRAMQMRSTSMDLDNKERVINIMKDAQAEMQRIDSDPEYAKQVGVNLYNSNFGPWGQGEHAGRELATVQRSDGKTVVYDTKDGTRNIVVDRAAIKDFAMNGYLQKLATTNPELAVKLQEQRQTADFRKGTLEHYKEELAAKEREGSANRANQKEIAGIYTSGGPHVEVDGKVKQLGLEKAEALAAATKNYMDLSQTLSEVQSGKAKVKDAATLRDLVEQTKHWAGVVDRLNGHPPKELVAKEPLSLKDVPKDVQERIIAHNIKFGNGSSIGDVIGMGNAAETAASARQLATSFPEYRHLVRGTEGFRPDLTGDPLGYKPPSDEKGASKAEKGLGSSKKELPEHMRIAEEAAAKRAAGRKLAEEAEARAQRETVSAEESRAAEKRLARASADEAERKLLAIRAEFAAQQEENRRRQEAAAGPSPLGLRQNHLLGTGLRTPY